MCTDAAILRASSWAAVSIDGEVRMAGGVGSGEGYLRVCVQSSAEIYIYIINTHTQLVTFIFIWLGSFWMMWIFDTFFCLILLLQSERKGTERGHTRGAYFIGNNYHVRWQHPHTQTDLWKWQYKGDSKRQPLFRLSSTAITSPRTSLP